MNPFLTGLGRRTLRLITEYPTPQELAAKIQAIENAWPYQDEKRKYFFVTRDKALASILYIACLRISEARRLVIGQFKGSESARDPFRLVAIKLSKAEKRDSKTGKIITRKDLYRKEFRFPRKGQRAFFTRNITDYLTLLTENQKNNDETRLFNLTNGRIDQIIKNMLGVPPHWLRAYGENYLYGLWDNDLIAVANYVQVDPRTLSLYIHRTPEKYLKRE